tara:strand:- start:893 stop:1411 length:519 start_codon:yes stop_codon:yes gene_type:complete
MNNKKTLSIWLIPGKKIINYQSILYNISKKLNSVEIIPHITLLSSFHNQKKYSIEKLKEVVVNEKCFRVKAIKIDTGSEYFQTLFIKIGINSKINSLRNKFLKYFICKEGDNYNPHMSLAYGHFTDYEKKDIIKNSDNILFKDEINITSIAIAENDEVNLKWKIIEQVKLND